MFGRKSDEVTYGSRTLPNYEFNYFYSPNVTPITMKNIMCEQAARISEQYTVAYKVFMGEVEGKAALEGLDWRMPLKGVFKK
jgi:hypothetical protein